MNPHFKTTYFLHVPRSGGTALVSNLKDLLTQSLIPTLNGNPIIPQTKDWLDFWNWDEDDQLELATKTPLLCNERRLGSHFMHTQLNYIICIRDPLQTRLSLLNKYISDHVDTEQTSLNPNLEEETAERIRDLFPSNLLTWMLSAKSDSETVTEDHLVSAVYRLSKFTRFSLETMSADFKTFFGREFNDQLGRHSYKYILTTPQERLAQILHRDVCLDYKLLAMT